MRVSGDIPGLIAIKTARFHRCRLVGRSTELARLSSPAPTASIILGEPGAGKTRLLAEAAKLKAHERTITLACHASASKIPLEPLVAIARSLRLGYHLDSNDAGRLSAPEADRLPYVRDIIASHCEQGRLLIQIDDLHWADESTVDAIDYLVDRLRDVPVRWHLAGRLGEPQTERLAAVLERSSFGDVMRLEALTRAEFRSLVEALTEENISDADLSDLHAKTGGNPLYVEQLLAAHAEGRARSDAGLRVLLEDRIRRLPRECRSVAHALAVRDGTAGLAEIGLLAGVTAERTQTAIFELESRWVIQPTPAGYKFRHELLRQACYRMIPQPQRRAMHAALADSVSAPWLRFVHLEGAGRSDTAIELMLTHGLACVDRADPAEAVSAFNTVLEKTVATSDEHFQARAGVVAAAAMRGDPRPAQSFLQEYRATASARPASIKLAALVRVIEAIFEGCDDCAAARPYLTDAIAEAENSSSKLLPRLYALAGAIASRTGSPASAESLLRRGIELCDDATPVRDVVRLKSWLGVAHGQLGDPKTGLTETADAAAIAKANGLTADYAQCCLKSCYVADLLGDERLYEEWCRRGLEAPEPRQKRVTAILRLNLATSALERGELCRGLELAAAVVAESEHGPPALRAQALSALALAYAMTGHAADAHSAVDALATLTLPEVWTRAARYVSGRVRELVRKDEAALDDYRAVTNLISPSNVKEGFDVRALVGEIRVLYRLQRFDDLRRTVDAFERATLPDWPLTSSFRNEVSGLASLVAGDLDRGRTLLIEAASHAKERFRAAWLRGIAGTATSDRELINDAIADFDWMGAPVAADSLRASAHSLGYRPRIRPRKTGEFTESEARVAILVGTGKTNLEIAKQLGLSGKTVEHYVSNILAKRGLRSRVEIAALVAAGSLFAADGSSTDRTRASKPLGERYQWGVPH